MRKAWEHYLKHEDRIHEALDRAQKAMDRDKAAADRDKAAADREKASAEYKAQRPVRRTHPIQRLVL